MQGVSTSSSSGQSCRPELDATLDRSDGRQGGGRQGGRPPMDPVLILKVPVIQALYGLSDAQAAFHIMDRRTLGRFLSLDDGARAPDETTIRRFREALARTGAVEKLLARFDAHLKDAGYPAMGGQIVDATIVAAPRRRMTDAGKEIVKGGGIPPDWQQANPWKPVQKDRHAGVRLQIPYQCRPAPRLRPDMDRHRRRPA